MMSSNTDKSKSKSEIYGYKDNENSNKEMQLTDLLKESNNNFTIGNSLYKDEINLKYNHRTNKKKKEKLF